MIYDRNGKLISLPNDNFVNIKISDAFAAVQNDIGSVYVYNKHGQRIQVISNVLDYMPLSSGFIFQTNNGWFELDTTIVETYEPVKYSPISRSNPPQVQTQPPGGVSYPPANNDPPQGNYPQGNYPQQGPVLYPMPPINGGCGSGPMAPWGGGGYNPCPCMPGPVYMAPMQPMMPMQPMPILAPSVPCWNGGGANFGGGASFGFNLNFFAGVSAGFGMGAGANYGGNYGSGYGGGYGYGGGPFGR